MIDYLIHFCMKGAEPFRSLSALPDAESLRLMRAMYVPRAVFWERFEDPEQYLRMRRATECWVRQGFIAKGGLPIESYPIYLIYGRSKWLAAAADPVTLATTVEIQVPLELFAATDISFTYPDSMVSDLMMRKQDPACYLPEYHGQVFTLAEICALVEKQGLPGEKWGTNLPPHLANYIEAQVWNHQPLIAYKRALGFHP